MSGDQFRVAMIRRPSLVIDRTALQILSGDPRVSITHVSRNSLLGIYKIRTVNSAAVANKFEFSVMSP